MKVKKRAYLWISIEHGRYEEVVGGFMPAFPVVRAAYITSHNPNEMTMELSKKAVVVLYVEEANSYGAAKKKLVKRLDNEFSVIYRWLKPILQVINI